MAQKKQPAKTTAVAKRQPNKIQALSQFLEGRREEIVKILPPQLDVERVIKTAIMASMENPDIGQKCTAISIYRSVVQASLMGLTVGSGFNEGYFIRYGDACTFRASYLGWSKVAKRSDGVDVIRASVVYSGDEFEMCEQPPLVKHKPVRISDRGELEGAVAVAYTLRKLNDGRTAHELYDFSFVDRDELAQAKKLADQRKESPSWRAWPGEMRKKVAIRRLCKLLPRNEHLDRLTRIENSADDGVVDVPDPAIPSDMDRMVVDARFDDMGPPAPQGGDPGVVDAELVDDPPAEATKPDQGRQTATSKLKGQMAKSKPKDPPKAASKAKGSAKGRSSKASAKGKGKGKAKATPAPPPPPPPPPPDEEPPPDVPDYGGQADLEF